MLNLDNIRKEFTEDINSLAHEVNTVYSRLVSPLRDVETSRFRFALYGYVMDCFARIDLLSKYSKGPQEKQTPRMIAFMEKYIRQDREVNRVAVQMWRHTLMHTGKPQYLYDRDLDITYGWLLHWSTELPEGQHFTFSEKSPSEKIFNMGLDYLIEDLKIAIEKYLADLSVNPELQSNFQNVQLDIQKQEFSST